ncbi:MAG: sugar nucleotide-binding protein [Candidatus Roizmanbacteria bacterium]|nr:sugar nucleotide-binding protein [Candidatus Roizmanbacteria bacterium]
MKKIAVTGASGLVGTRIIELLSDKFEFIPLKQENMDITDKDSVNSYLKSISFDLLLHLAAYTNVVGAETEKEKAFLINETGTKNLLDVVQSVKKEFLYISTDFVFDGTTPPYVETSTPNPISVYGASKYAGEKVVGNNGMIVRISYPYRSVYEIKKDIFRTLKGLLENGKTLSMVDDSLMVPTFIDDIAYGLGYLMNNYSNELFHLVGADAMSPYTLAMSIAKAFGLNESLVGKTTYDVYFANKAKGPRYSDIRSNKNTFYKMHTFEEGLSLIKNQLSL